MKTPFLAYSKGNMNQVVTRRAELEKINDKVYTFLYEKSSSGENMDRIGVVLKIADVYFLEGAYSRQSLQRQDIGKIGGEAVDNFRTSVEHAMGNGLHVPILNVKVYEALGWDTAPLLLYREQRRLKQEAAHHEKELATEAAKQRAVEMETQRLVTVNQSFQNGELIKSADFITLCKRVGIEIPLRTLGTLNKSVVEVAKDGQIRYYVQRNKRKPQFDGCRKAIAAYVQRTSNPQV